MFLLLSISFSWHHIWLQLYNTDNLIPLENQLTISSFDFKDLTIYETFFLFDRCMLFLLAPSNRLLSSFMLLAWFYPEARPLFSYASIPKTTSIFVSKSLKLRFYYVWGRFCSPLLNYIICNNNPDIVE